MSEDSSGVECLLNMQEVLAPNHTTTKKLISYMETWLFWTISKLVYKYLNQCFQELAKAETTSLLSPTFFLPLFPFLFLSILHVLLFFFLSALTSFIFTFSKPSTSLGTEVKQFPNAKVPVPTKLMS